MDVKDYLNIKHLKNTELLQIKPFVIGFTCFSLVSIWASDTSYSNLKQIKKLKEDSKTLKSLHVNNRTSVMTLTQRSHLLKKAQSFNLFPSSQPVTHIDVDYEN